jgi:hypothetical protein
MTHFEYISVAVSLVYSLVLAKLLGTLPAALRPGRRYWVHAIWIANLLFVTVGSWWQIWSYREVEWSPPSFLILLAIPSVMYLRAAILVSDDPGAVASWRSHYYEVRSPFFLLQLLGITNLVASRWIIVGAPLSTQALAANAVFAALSILAAISAAPRLHEAFALVSVVAFATGLFVPPW